MTQLVKINLTYLYLYFNSLVFQNYKNQIKYNNTTKGLWQ